MFARRLTTAVSPWGAGMIGGDRDSRAKMKPTWFHVLIAVLCSARSRDAFLILSPLNRLSNQGKSRDHVGQSQAQYHSRSRALGVVGAMVEQETHQEEEQGSPWPVVEPISSASLMTSFKAALAAREPMMRRLVEEKTDCYRLFHGAVEGCPGLTVDRYGTVVLVQTFRDPPVDFGASTVDELCRLASIAMNDAATQSSSSSPSLSSSSVVTSAFTDGLAEPEQKSAVTFFSSSVEGFFPVWNDRRKKDNRRRRPMRTSGDGSKTKGLDDDHHGEGSVDLDASFEERFSERGFSGRTDSGSEAQRSEAGWGGERGGEDGGLEPEVPPRHKLSTEHEPSPEALGVKVGLENGVRYPLAARHRGLDPWLFLDLRAARTWVLNNSEGLEVLNLFSYTGGVGVAAACGGAKSVWNVDFSSTAHEVGRGSLKLNAAAAGDCKCEWKKLDVLPTVRQLAGIATKDYRREKGGKYSRQETGGRGRGGRGRGGRYNSNDGFRGGGRRGDGEGGSDDGATKNKEVVLKPKQFDVVFLDPSDVVEVDARGCRPRTGLSVFVQAVSSGDEGGGAVVATNHVSSVDCAEWVESLSRCAAKAGREVESVEVLLPAEDFPSPDGKHPLKVAIFRV